MWYHWALVNKDLGEVMRAYGKVRKPWQEKPNDKDVSAAIAAFFTFWEQ